MAIKIEKQQTKIPVEIGDLKFAFDVTDESIKNFRANAIKIQKELEGLENKEDENLELSKDVLRKGFDLMLGEGAFEKIYQMTPSLPYLMNYFIQLVGGLSKELEQLGTIQERAQKYLSKRKK